MQVLNLVLTYRVVMQADINAKWLLSVVDESF